MLSTRPSGELSSASEYQKPYRRLLGFLYLLHQLVLPGQLRLSVGEQNVGRYRPAFTDRPERGSNHPGQSRTKAEESNITRYLLRLRPCVLILLTLPRLVSRGQLSVRTPPTLFTPVSSRSSRLTTAGVWCSELIGSPLGWSGTLAPAAWRGVCYLARNSCEPFGKDLYPPNHLMVDASLLASQYHSYAIQHSKENRRNVAREQERRDLWRRRVTGDAGAGPGQRRRRKVPQLCNPASMITQRRGKAAR